MNNTAIKYVVLALASLLFSGCVSLSTGDQMQQDIEAIKAQQKTMQENYDAEKTRLTKMIASARGDVSELKQVLKQARALLQRNNADLGVELQKNRQALDELRGNVEELEFKLKKANEDLQLFKEDTDRRFSGNNVGANLPDKPVPLFAAGKKAYDAGKNNAARNAFEKFVTTFPTHGKAGQAQYLLGQTYFKEQQWVRSVLEFEKVIKKYDKSTYVDDAMYHIGAALMKSGRCKQAKGWFQLVISEHGNSEWAGDARQKINAIKSGQCG